MKKSNNPTELHGKLLRRSALSVSRLQFSSSHWEVGQLTVDFRTGNKNINGGDAC